jgi:phenylpropionate dioxygenase-like ring-hydroxylating dioxygenase large terminal subunit
LPGPPAPCQRGPPAHAFHPPPRFDTLNENLFDPSHIPFAHHKIMGSATRDKATPLGEIKTVEDISPKGGGGGLGGQGAGT